MQQEKLADEVLKIFQALEDFSTSHKPSLTITDSKFEKGLLVFAAIAFFIAITGIYFNSTRLIALIAGLLFLLSAVFLAFIQARFVVTTIRSPMKGFAKDAHQRLNHRLHLIDDLSKHRATSLQLAIKTLENELARRQKWLSLLFGAVDKAGIIPAGLALFYAATKFQSGDNGFAANMLMSFLFGLYSGTFFGHRLSAAISSHIDCLRDALEISTTREQLQFL